ncbi:MAG: protein-methionine-sulfoxide reductase catalytic subunit MsrP [Roseivivax sp.]|nr:protein-methionine-sulfoxide reductase catalytic subunit MsrP [Roseivivax sp.]
MANRWKNDLTHESVTPAGAFFNRRQLLGGIGATGALAALPTGSGAQAALTPNSLEDISTYNNYYEFGTGKDDPAKYAHMLTTKPWRITIDGMVDKPGEYDLADILSQMTMEERIYRFRCVEAWSMVIPWNGFELADLLTLVGVKPEATYVAFETVLRPEEMPGTRFPVIEWPYVEGLRLDEAMHPLTLMATGVYGMPLPNQCGAPIRLVVPWKYGFKSIKAITRITLTDTQPPTTWNKANAGEYGFYSNVNPEVDHPRWSQAKERRIGAGLFAGREPTPMFNGYAEEVAGLYEGMDLKANF